MTDYANRNWQRGTERWNARLNEEKVREIRSRAGEKNIALAAEFGVSESMIENVKHRRNWKHVT